MKKFAATLVSLLVLIAFVFAGCTSGDDTSSDGAEIIVTAKQSQISISSSEVADYDYTALFTITCDGEEVQVLQTYIDSSQVSESEGTYLVTCTYEGKEAQVSVTVYVESMYELTLLVESGEINVKQSLWNTYDYKSLFKAYVDGSEAEITDDMIQNGVQEAIGDYTYAVTYQGITKTLIVHIVADHEIQVVLTYRGIEIAQSDVADFDCTTLFSLYVDGEAVQVTADMIDASALEGAKQGDSCLVILNYTYGKTSVTEQTTVNVVADRELIITAKDIVTYPNSEIIDLTTLFEIKLGNSVIPVTIDMIEGAIDYSKEGVNEITLNYNGVTKTATVTVRQGVVINYAHGDTVTVRSGTDKNTYDFASDFIVVINGIRFRTIPDSYIDISQVNFNEVGVCTATISIKYNNATITGRNPSFEVVEKQITYNVVGVSYTIKTKENTVTLTQTQTDYSPFSNLEVTLNGYNVRLVENPNANGVTACYAQVVSGVDFTVKGVQQVEIAVYVYGADSDPVIVTYNVIIDLGVKITGSRIAVFTGATLYTTDLFTITQNGEEVAATHDMICGKVDTFTSGVYTVEIEYEGVTAQATVVVLDREMIGTYVTWLTTIPEEEEDYDDGEYGDEGWGEYYSIDYDIQTVAAKGTTLGNLRILEDGTITFNGHTVSSVEGIDQSTLLLSVSNRDYTLYYDNGIVVLDPDNSFKLGFSDYVRPIVYFNRSIWAIEEIVTINYANDYVLSSTTSGAYSIDTFRIRSVADDSEMWYALKTHMLSKSGGDTIYEVTWGVCTYSDDYTGEVGSQASLTLNGEVYPFTVSSAGVCKIIKPSNDNPYKGKVYTGTVNGLPAQLRINSSGNIQLTVNSVPVFKDEINNTTDVQQMKNGGVLANNILFIYNADIKDENGIFSYKFLMDAEHNTFTLLERDMYYGLYVYEGMYVFLDGYGTGLFNANINYGITEQLRYTVKSGEVSVEFFNILPTFKYSRQVSFYIAPLLNVLTVKSFGGADMNGAQFENYAVTDGAIVRVETYRIASTSQAVTRPQLLKGITIITKDGELDEAQKLNCVDTSAIGWSTAGFYQFSITVSVGGKNVTSYYSLEIITEQYKDSPIAATYNSVSAGGISLTIDTYGRVQVSGSGVTYSGTVTINADNSFYIKAYSARNVFIGAKGVMLTNGIVYISFNGALTASGLFRSAAFTQRSSGGSGYILREFTSGSIKVYTLSHGTDIPVIVTLEAVEGTTDTFVVKTTEGQAVGTFKISWGSDLSGLQIIS